MDKRESDGVETPKLKGHEPKGAWVPPSVDLCYTRSAAILPVLFSMYSGARFLTDMDPRKGYSVEKSVMEPVFRRWTEVAYKVAEWCGKQEIHLSNLYSVLPAYFAVETDRGTEHIIGFELMCGRFVSLGRIMGVIVHEDSMDLILPSSSVSVMLSEDGDGHGLEYWMRTYLDSEGLGLALPTLALDDLSDGMIDFLSHTTMVYNIDGRALTARAISNIVGCQIQDVEFILNSVGADRFEKLVLTQPYEVGRRGVHRKEILVYKYAQAKAEGMSEKLGIPPANIRLISRLGALEEDRGLLTDEWRSLYVCEGIARSLNVWAYRLRRTEGALEASWEPGLSEKEWRELAGSIGAEYGLGLSGSKRRRNRRRA